MLPVLDNEAIREADRHTIEDMGIPSLDLMENAASGVVDALRDSFPKARRILILCGRGNNGGDGLLSSKARISQLSMPSSNLTLRTSSWTPSSAPASTDRSADGWPRSWNASERPV